MTCPAFDSQNDHMSDTDTLELQYSPNNPFDDCEHKEVTLRNRKKYLKKSEHLEVGQVTFRGAALAHTPLLICTPADVDMSTIVECLIIEGAILPPHFIISALTQTGDSKSFKLAYHREMFIEGMQTLMNETGLWVLTHGRDNGLVKLLGEAYHQHKEYIQYQNKWCEVLRKPVNYCETVALISIVSEKEVLSNGGKYTQKVYNGKQRKFLQMTKKNGSYYLNMHHNIHIVVRDSEVDTVRTKQTGVSCDNDPLMRFRCHFEKHICTHVIPRLVLKDRTHVLKPRELEVKSFQRTPSMVKFVFGWENPYFNKSYASLFEDFEMTVYGSRERPMNTESQELKCVSMKPRGRQMRCTVKIRGDIPNILLFVVKSRTLYGKSSEASCQVDLTQFHVNVPKTQVDYRNLPMSVCCVPSDTYVSVSFEPYFGAKYHVVTIEHAEGSIDQASNKLHKDLDSGQTSSHFTDLDPETVYKLTVYPMKMQENGDLISLIEAGVSVNFTTLKAYQLEKSVCVMNDHIHISTPMIYLVVGGGSDEMDKVLHCLKTRAVAILVLAGTRGAADAITSVLELFNVSMITNEEELYVTEVVRQLASFYLFRPGQVEETVLNGMVAKLMEIGRFCQRTKRIRAINVWETKRNLENISKEYLKCWILCGGEKHKNQSSFERDVRLAVHLNKPNVALTEIFEDDKYHEKRITNDLFQLGLLVKDRERFVDLFLEYGFQVHTYLNEKRLKYIFEFEDELDPYDRDFFITTTVEGIMGLTGDEDKLPDDFVSHGIPQVIERMTGLLISFITEDYRVVFLPRPETDAHSRDRFVDMSLAYVQLKNKKIMEKEREAQKMLTVYAVLMNRCALAKYLWKHSSTPLMTALFCAAIYKKLSHYCHESYQKTSALNSSSNFTDLAVKLLDLTFTESEQITHEGLQCKYVDWNDRSPIEFAHGVDNKEFMAHPSCQKWITRTYFGEITLRETTTMGHIPDFFKILACALTFVPMYFWINFSPIGKGNSSEPKNKYDIVIDVTTQHMDATQSSVVSRNQTERNRSSSSVMRQWSFVESPPGGALINNNNGKNLKNSRISMFPGHLQVDPRKASLLRSGVYFQARIAASPPFWKKVLLLWGAPVTKFSTDAFFYALYLSLFSLVTIWPTCGNLLLDFFFWTWSASITFEHARLCYTKSKTLNHLPLRNNILDIIVQLVFLIGFVWLRIYGLWEGMKVTPHLAKSFLGAFLIYFFMRVFRMYYPIHPKLGPAMVKLTYMVTDDFVSYLYVVIVFMVSSGIAATAIIFPHHPLNITLLKRVLRRGVMALFKTDTRDLDAIDNARCKINFTRGFCARLSNGLSFSYDDSAMYSTYGIDNRSCSVSTIIVWIIVLQYGYVCSVFLRSLLTAMFGITGRNVGAISEQIWMYDRYEIIMDYERKPRLPPPLCMISYLLSAFAYAYKCTLRLSDDNYRRDDGTPDDSFKKYAAKHGRLAEFVSMLSQFTKGDTSEWAGQPRWKDDATNVYWKLKAEKVFDMTSQKDKNEQKLKLLMIKTDLIQQASTNQQRINFVLRRSIAQVMRNQNKLIQGTSDSGETGQQQKCRNVRSRQSPYVYSTQSRYSLSNEEVSWQVEMSDYDPVQLSIRVDPMLACNEHIQQEGGGLPSSSTAAFHNPVGRTGLRGRGCLPTYGSNVFLLAIVTRDNDRKLEFMYLLDAHRSVTESAMVFKDWTCLPKGHKVSDAQMTNVIESSYSQLCYRLNQNLANGIATERHKNINRLSSGDFIEFFERLISINERQTISSAMVHQGYLDDIRNTDDAWIEVEVWNFHISSMISPNVQLPIQAAFAWGDLDMSNTILFGLGRAVRNISLLREP